VLLAASLVAAPVLRAQTNSQGVARPSGSAQQAPQPDGPPIRGEPLDLRWDAPPGCPGREEVIDRIRALAGSSLDQTDGLAARGRITRVNGRFQLTLLVPDGVEVRARVIESDTCVELAGAAAVTLALLLGIEPRIDEQPEERQPEDEPSAAPPARAAANGDPSVDGSDEDRPGDPDRQGGRWAFVLQAPVLGVDAGPLPRPSPGAGLGIGTRRGSWRVLFTGTFSAPQSVQAPGLDESVGSDLQRLTGRLTTCRGWRSGRLELSPCVGVALEYVAARGFGDGISPHERRAVWPAPGVGVVAYGHASKSLAFFVGAGGYLELARPYLVIDGIGEVAQLEPAAAGATVGLEWIFQRVAPRGATAIVSHDGRVLPTWRRDPLGIGSAPTPHRP